MARVLRIGQLPRRFEDWLALSLARKLFWVTRKFVGVAIGTVLFGAVVVAYNYPAEAGAVVDGQASVWSLLGPALSLAPVLAVVFVGVMLAVLLPTTYEAGGSDEGMRIRW